MQPYVTDLLATVERAVPALRALEDAGTSRPPRSGAWSAREVIGHLIDSASNNHQRFVRARWQDDLVFTGYSQDEWVVAQGYADAPWPELVDLWALFNRHIARVMERVPGPVRTRPHVRHNLDRLAWRPVPAGQPATLDYFMADYVGHLRHHLAQVLGPAWDDEAGRP